MNCFTGTCVFPPDRCEYFKAFGEKDFDIFKSLLTPPKYTCCRISRNYNVDNVLISLNKALKNLINGSLSLEENLQNKHPVLKDMILMSVEALITFFQIVRFTWL